MRFHLLFPTVKTAAFYYVPIESYSKNIHPFSILKRVLVRGRHNLFLEFFMLYGFDDLHSVSIFHLQGIGRCLLSIDRRNGHASITMSKQ